MAEGAKKRRLMAEINVVPYIDVMLVLLIIFMVTAPLLTEGIKVDLPKAGAKPLDKDLLKNNEPLVLSVNRDGEFYLNVGDNENEPVAPETVIEQTKRVLRASPETPVLVKADRAVAHGSVVTGMVLLQQGGAEQVGIVTDPIELPERKE